MVSVRKPAVAGMFYSGSEEELTAELKDLLSRTKSVGNFQNVFGLVVPHAGYRYSGKTAAYAYNTIADKRYKTVIVISPSHREYFEGINIYSGDYYETPLGQIPIDKMMRDKLADSSKHIRIGTTGHGPEHALEVQLPFLQHTLLDFALVPVVIGDQNRTYVFELAEKLAEVVNDETLIVASTDLSHFYSRERANKMDGLIEKLVNNFDYIGLQENLENRVCEACGGGAVVALMKAAELKNYKKSKVLSHTDSGDVTGDLNEVVGYLSAVIYE